MTEIPGTQSPSGIGQGAMSSEARTRLSSQRIESIVQAALDLPPDARDAFVAEHCGPDAELRHAVERLLRVPDEDLSGFLNQSPFGASVASPETADNAGLYVPLRVGSYEIIGEIGRGGMGTVYEARQKYPRRTVALKLIRPGMATPSILRRFQHEADVLGQLQHPGIAQVLEAGVAEVTWSAGAPPTRQPFFAMERIRGRPLDEYVRAESLHFAEVLELFAEICDAVHHAHQKGVIHRDLKPGNILVATEADTTNADARSDLFTAAANSAESTFGPRAAAHAASSRERKSGMRPPAAIKILDFGVARLTHSDSNLTTLHTEMGQLVGTIPYMSPEQVAGDTLSIDARSDIYALGVVLYELLAGRLPYEIRGRPIAEAARIIRDEEPLSLATALRTGSRVAPFASSKPAIAPDDVARPSPVHSTSSPTVGPRLDRDIEIIVGKAIAKDPARRYQSAAELAAEIRRYLAHEPIVARPPSAWYQFRKFARRNRAVVLAASLALFALVAGLVGVGWFAWTAATQRDAARVAQARAETEGERSAAVTRFLTNMLAAANRGAYFGEDLKVSQVLEKAAAEIDDGSLRDHPEVEAEVRTTIGRTYASISRLKDAEHHLRTALDIRRRQSTADALPIANSANVLAEFLLMNDRNEEAEPLAREALEIRRKRLGDDHVDTTTSLSNLGAALHGRGKLEEAVEIYERVLAARRQLLKPDDPYLTVPLTNLSGALDALGRRREAEAYMRESIDILRRGEFAEHPIMVTSLNNLGRTLFFDKRFAEAEPPLRDALKMARRLLGDDHWQVAAVARNYGELLLSLDRPDDAEALFREASRIDERVHGARHPACGANLHFLARALLLQNRPAESVRAAEAAIALRSELAGADAAETADSRLVLAEACLAAGDRDAAQAACRTALATFEKRFGPDSQTAMRARDLLEKIIAGRSPEFKTAPTP